MDYYTVVCNTSPFYCFQLSGNLQPLRDCCVNEDRCCEGGTGRRKLGGAGSSLRKLVRCLSSTALGGVGRASRAALALGGLFWLSAVHRHRQGSMSSSMLPPITWCGGVLTLGLIGVFHIVRPGLWVCRKNMPRWSVVLFVSYQAVVISAWHIIAEVHHAGLVFLFLEPIHVLCGSGLPWWLRR